MVAIRNLILFAASAVALVMPRDAAQIQTDLNYINSNVTALQQAISNYSGGGIIAAAPIQTASNNLNSAIQGGTTDAQNSAVATSSQSQSIIGYINSTLEPNIAKTINVLISKKAQLESDGLQSTVQNNLNTLKSSTDKFSSALEDKASSDQQSNAVAAANKIDSDLQKGINAFS